MPVTSLLHRLMSATILLARTALVVGKWRAGFFRVALLVCTCFPLASAGQLLQAGLAGWPGVGVQVNYVDLHTMYTLEAALQMDADPFAPRNALHVAASVGAALLPLNIWRTIGQADYGYDLDAGIRFGPRLVFVEDATRADKNQQFGLFLDPFLRYRRRIGPEDSNRFFFVEIGPRRPVLRAGLWLEL